MPNVEIITIGTELLLGATLDSNSAFLGLSLAEVGLDLYAKHSVGDNRDRLRDMLQRSLLDADGVITTGGLGPTVDDLTKDAIAAALDVELELHEPSLRAIEERFARSGRIVGENNRRQAILPRGAYVLINPHGTAPGFVAIGKNNRFIAALPGVPREMRPMVQERLLPWLREHFALRGGIITRTLRTVGIPESEIDRRIESLFRLQENPKIAVLAHANRVDVKIMAKIADTKDADSMIAPLETLLREAIGFGMYGVDDQTLEGQIVAKLQQRQATVGFAESCTGGALSERIVAIAGASHVFRGGVVAYANETKERLLGVPHDVLVAHGAVSREVAIAMADGACSQLGVDYALSTTGIAGPGGGTAEKPVGLVWIGLAQPGQVTQAVSYTFTGERNDIRSRAVTAGYAMLFQAL